MRAAVRAFKEVEARIFHRKTTQLVKWGVVELILNVHQIHHKEQKFIENQYIAWRTCTKPPPSRQNVGCITLQTGQLSALKKMYTNCLSKVLHHLGPSIVPSVSSQAAFFAAGSPMANRDSAFGWISGADWSCILFDCQGCWFSHPQKAPREKKGLFGKHIE